MFPEVPKELKGLVQAVVEERDILSFQALADKLAEAANANQILAVLYAMREVFKLTPQDGISDFDESLPRPSKRLSRFLLHFAKGMVTTEPDWTYIPISELLECSAEHLVHNWMGMGPATLRELRELLAFHEMKLAGD